MALILAAQAGLFAQWLDYPTSGVPHTPDGKPNLAAPTPRNADETQLLGYVRMGNERRTVVRSATDTQVSREFTNIAASLGTPVPYQPWAADLVRNEASNRASIRTFTACRAGLRESGPTTITSAFPSAGPRDHPDGAQYAVPPDLHRWPAVSEGS